MSMYRPHWIPDAQHWSTMPATTRATLSPPALGPGLSQSPPKDNNVHPDLPPPASSSSSSVSTTASNLPGGSSGQQQQSTKCENNSYESLNHPNSQPNQAENRPSESKEVVKAESADNGLVKPQPHSYSDYYSQHYNPHNDLGSAFINCNSANSVRSSSAGSHQANIQQRPPNNNHKSNKNRPNAGNNIFY